MLVIKHIEKEVAHCSECPFYATEIDMGAIYHSCELKGKRYEAILSDLNWNYSPNQHISNYCPYSKIN